MQNCYTTEAENAEVQWHYCRHITGTCGRVDIGDFLLQRQYNYLCTWPSETTSVQGKRFLVSENRGPFGRI
jgi:hypothetical protein